MKRLDLEESDEHYLKALVYGRPGTGKTGFGVSAPRPLILLSERQGYPHIKAAAKRLGKPVPPTLYMDTIDDYRLVVRALTGDRSKPFVVKTDAGATVIELAEWPETVVLDSLTDACKRIVDDIRRQSPQKIAKDGLPVDSDRFWNVLTDRFQKLVSMFRDAPMNVLFLCLLDERITRDDDDQIVSRWVGPQLDMRKMPGVVQAAVNVVGVTYRKIGKPEAGGERPIVYGISTVGSDYMELKPFRPLRDQEVMDFASWCDRVRGIDDGSKAPPPMESTAEATTIEVMTADGAEKVGEVDENTVAKPTKNKQPKKAADSAAEI